MRTPLLARNSKAAMCVYRRVAPCVNTSNACGAPHSIFSRPENLLLGKMYWEADLLNQVAAHMKRGSAGSTPSLLGAVLLSAQDEAAITAQQGLSTATPAAIANISKFCTQVPDLSSPSAALFGIVPVSGVLTLALNANPANLTALVRTMFTDATTDSLYLRTLLEQVAVGTLQDAMGRAVRFTLPSAADTATLESKITGLLTGTGSGVNLVRERWRGGRLSADYWPPAELRRRNERTQVDFVSSKNTEAPCVCSAGRAQADRAETWRRTQGASTEACRRTRAAPRRAAPRRAARPAARDAPRKVANQPAPPRPARSFDGPPRPRSGLRAASA